MQHLEQQARSPARAVFLLMGGEITGAHYLAIAVVTAALAGSNTALRGTAEIAFGGVMKKRA
jgi:hypothetical protein